MDRDLLVDFKCRLFFVIFFSTIVACSIFFFSKTWSLILHTPNSCQLSCSLDNVLYIHCRREIWNLWTESKGYVYYGTHCIFAWNFKSSKKKNENVILRDWVIIVLRNSAYSNWSACKNLSAKKACKSLLPQNGTSACYPHIPARCCPFGHKTKHINRNFTYSQTHRKITGKERAASMSLACLAEHWSNWEEKKVVFIQTQHTEGHRWLSTCSLYYNSVMRN